MSAIEAGKPHGRGRATTALPSVPLVTLMKLFLTALPVAGLALVGLGAGPPPIRQDVRVEMTEFAFRPAIIRVSAGRPVRMLLVNRGQIAHQFDAIAGLPGAARLVTHSLLVDVDRLRVVLLQPGASAAVEFFPRQPGRLNFACTIEGHREAGMAGWLEVR